jgi:hypothetical protein
LFGYNPKKPILNMADDPFAVDDDVAGAVDFAQPKVMGLGVVF